MFISTLISTLGVFAAIGAAVPNELKPRATCAKDNCLRLLIASSAKPGPAAVSTDCSSYMVTTVTPCPTTVYSATTTVFVTPSPISKRDVALAPKVLDARQAGVCSAVTSAPTATPTYASVCSDRARYSSACSCNGVPASTKILGQSTVTAVSTKTITTSATASATTTTACNSFHIVTFGGDRSGQYFAGDDSTTLTPYGSLANIFQLNLDGSLRIVNGSNGAVAPAVGSYIVTPELDIAFLPQRPTGFDASILTPLKCSVTALTDGTAPVNGGEIKCVSSLGNAFYVYQEADKLGDVFVRFGATGRTDSGVIFLAETRIYAQCI